MYYMYYIYYGDYDTSLHFNTLCPSARVFDFILFQGNMIANLTTMVRIHVFLLKNQVASYDIERSTENIVTMLNTMVWWAIDLWWIEIPPPTLALFWWRIERKRPLKRGRSSFEKSFEKDSSLSLSLDMTTLDASRFLIHVVIRMESYVMKTLVGYKFFNATNRLEWVSFSEWWHTNLKAKTIWTYLNYK